MGLSFPIAGEEVRQHAADSGEPLIISADRTVLEFNPVALNEMRQNLW
jgi:hypothetical protein